MSYVPTPRTTPTRYRERAHYDRPTVHAILDEALICHLGYLSAGNPAVLPTTHARLGEVLYLHGSTGSGPVLAAMAARSGFPVCVTVTLVDGLVLARSAMHHSLNYRSVVIFGSARLVVDRSEKLRALAALVDHVASGRAADSRAPVARELAAVAVLALDLVEVSAKVRTGGPVDDPEDTALPHWAGVVPLSLAAGTPVPADDLDPATPMPRYLQSMCRNITELRGLQPAATDEEIAAAARQYVRKVSGITRPSAANLDPFETAVAEVAATTTRLLAELPARKQPPKTVPPLRQPQVRARFSTT